MFLDLDGTVLNGEQRVSAANKKALSDALDNNIDVYLVSGRPVFFVEQVALSIDPRCEIVGYNGACYTVNGKNHSAAIGKKELGYLLDTIRHYSIEKYYLKGKRRLYCSDADPRFTYPDLENQGIIQVQLIQNMETPGAEFDCIYKALVIDRDDDKLQEFGKACSTCLSVTSSHATSLDIMEKSVNKGDAIDEITRLKGYRKERIMAIGDGLNDMEMLSRAGYGIAMGNGNQKLKEKALYVTKSNNEDGVAHAINKFCF